MVKTIRAITLLSGAIIGAGIFGLPYVIAQSGALLGAIEIILLGVVVTYIHLCAAEVTLRTRHSYQLPGLVAKYLGKTGGILFGVVFVFLSSCAMIAYLIGMGAMLFELTDVGNAQWWSIGAWVLIAILVFLGLKSISRVAFPLGALLVVTILALVVWGAPHIDVSNLMTMDITKTLVPFGVIMFAMGGVAAIPELEKIVPSRTRPLTKIIIFGTAIPMILYLLFSLMVVGVTGEETTQIATIGLGAYLGVPVFFLGGVITVLAMSTSFLIIGLAVRQVFEWDLHFKKIYAWGIAMGVPLIFYLLGVREFVRTIGIAGALGSGFEGLLIIATFFQARRKGDLEPHGVFVYYAKPISIIVVCMLFLGIASIFIS